MHVKTFLLGICCAAIASTCFAQITLLVDFQGDLQRPPTAATASDFAANNSAVDLMAPVNAIDGDNVTTSTIFGFNNTGSSVSSTIALNNEDAFNTFRAPTAGDPILGDYIFTNSNRFPNNPDPSFTVFGLEEIRPSSLVTIVVYSLGDQTDQVADLILEVGGVTQTSSVTSSTDPFQTFTFTAPQGFDSFSITADNAGEGDQFAVINGFSVTSSVPEPTSTAFLLGGLLVFAGVRRRSA